MQISIKRMLNDYIGATPKAWAHDRASTVGANEVGQCARKTWFTKQDAPHDADYEDRHGARVLLEVS